MSGSVTGASVGTLEIDRSRLDTIEQTGVYVEYRPFFFTATGNVRWGVEMFEYSDNIPEKLGDINNNVGENAYNTVTLTGTEGGSYPYQLHFGSVDGALRCAETSGGNFAADAAAESRYAELKAAAETPDNPTDPTNPADPTEPTGNNICKWDNVDHGTSFWGRLVKFSHSILYFFAHLFGRK